MIVQRLALTGRDGMYVHTEEWRDSNPVKLDPGLFPRLPRCCILNGFILGLHVSSREEPAVQPPMVDEQNGVALGMEH
jgi:hypothetical protein